MARVTATEVKEIIETSLTDAIVDAHIAAATALVDKTLSGESLGAALEKEIERWLTAHLLAVGRERQAKKEEAGGAKIEYTGQYGLGLESTSYGQQVLALDTSGKMASLSGKRVEFNVIESFQ